MSREPRIFPGFVPSSRLWTAARERKRESVDQRPALRLAEFLDGLSEKAGDPSSGSLRSVLNASPSLDLKSAFGQMNASYQEKVQARLGKRGLEELFSLSREKHWGFFLEEWVGYSRRLRDQDKLAEAELALGQVEKWAGALGNEEQAVLGEAKRELAVLHGKGGFGRQVEFLAPRVLREGADPWAILGFGVGGAVFQGTRWALFSRLSQSRKVGFWGARALAFGAGTIVETPAIVATAKLGREFSGISQEWGVEAWKNEILSAGMTQLFLKGAGAAVGKAPRGLGRSLAPVGLFGGIYLAHQAEEVLGWRTPVSDSERITGSLSSFFQILIGGGFANGAFGKTLSRWRGEWSERSRQMISPQPIALKWSFPTPQPAAAGRGIVFMSSTGGEGKPPAKVLDFPGNGDGPKGVAVPEGPQPLAPHEISAEFHQVIEAAEILRGRTMRRFQELQLKLAVLRNHWVLRRGGMHEVAEMVGSFSSCLSAIEGDLREISELKTRLDASTTRFATQHDEARVGVLERHRTSIGSIFELKSYLELMLQKIQVEVRASDPSDLQTRIYLLESILEALGEESLGGIGPTGHPSIGDLMPHRVKGMLQGLLVKRALRASPAEESIWNSHGGTPPLSAATLWVNEAMWMSDLMESLKRAEGSENPRFLLRRIGQTLSLAHGGTRSDPFRGWLSVHLPILTAAHEGDLARTMKWLDPLHPLLDEETRWVTEWGVWWLCQALRGPGDPREWMKQFYASGLDMPVKLETYHVLDRLAGGSLDASRVEALKIRGSWGAAQMAVQYFLASPFDADRAIHSALYAPLDIREDTLGFTAALLGAFHGLGFFSQGWFEDVLHGRLYPNRREDDLLERRSRLHLTHSRLDSPVSDLIARWKKPAEPKTPGPLATPIFDPGSANETGRVSSSAPPASRLRLVGEGETMSETTNWYPRFRAAFDSDTHRATILDFSLEWAREQGLPWREADARAFLERLEELPAYLLVDLAYAVSFDPPGGKALLLRLGLIPQDSSLSKDRDVLEELSQKAAEQMEKTAWRSLAEMTIYMYEERFGPWFFPERFQRLSESERLIWINKLGALPPSILTHMSGISMLKPAYVLALLHRLGISSLGEPTSSTPPEP